MNWGLRNGAQQSSAAAYVDMECLMASIIPEIARASSQKSSDVVASRDGEGESRQERIGFQPAPSSRRRERSTQRMSLA